CAGAVRFLSPSARILIPPLLFAPTHLERLHYRRVVVHRTPLHRFPHALSIEERLCVWPATVARTRLARLTAEQTATLAEASVGLRRHHGETGQMNGWTAGCAGGNG